MLKQLIFVTAMLLPIGAAQADDDPDFSTYRNCVAKYCYEDEFIVAAELTPPEQEKLDHLKARMARIIADAGEKMEAKAKEEAEREAAWRSQCVLPWLAIGCPPKAGS